MLALSGSNVSQAKPTRNAQVRNVALGAAIIVAIYFLLRSVHLGTGEIEHSTRKSFHAISHLAPESWRNQRPSRITKVSAVFGKENELYEAALRSHEKHNRLNGYEMKVLRESIVKSYLDMPSYMLSILVNELTKPVEERMEWLVWFAPDVVILNPQIPLEIFLPPEDSNDIRLLATHDQTSFNDGVFFLRVHEWSAKLLIEVLGVKKDNPKIEKARNKAQKAFEIILEKPQFRDHVAYQPRTWYNSPSTNFIEGIYGDFLVHFDQTGGDKWSAMANTIDQLAQHGRSWSVPLKKTAYVKAIEMYWDRVQRVRDLLDLAEPRMKEEGVESAVRRAQYALTFEADRTKVMDDAIQQLARALE